MKPNNLKIGVRGKFTLGTTGIILLIGLTTAVVVDVTLTQTLTKELQERGIIIARNLATTSVDAILTDDFVALHRLLSDSKEIEKEIAYIYILDAKGNVLAHTFEEGFPRAFLDEGLFTQDIQLLETGDGFTRDIAFPVLEGRGGIVHVGLSESLIRERIADVREIIILLTFSVVSLGIFLAYITGNLITKPIYALTKGVEEIGRGNLDSKINVSTNDEIATLANTFNQMAFDLKKSIGQLKEYSTQLEQKVEERTKELLLLQKINNILNAGATLDEILQAITQGITSVFNYDSCAVHLLDEGRSALVCRSYYMDSKTVSKIEEFTGIKALNYITPLHKGNPLTKIVETRGPLITNDIPDLIKGHTTSRSIKASAGAIAKIVGTKSGIGVPLLAGEKVVGVIGIGSRGKLTGEDVTRLTNFAAQVGLAVEKARLEEELKGYSEHLEQNVEEKTKQLIQAEKLASLGQLAAGVAHEINNPLANILLDAEALHRKGLDEGASGNRLEEIISQVEIAKNIVKNLLEFSRQVKPEVRAVEVEILLDKILAMVSHDLTNIQVEKDFHNVSELKGDPGQLQQVFLNIILNAIQVMPDGGKLGMTIKGGDGFVEVAISDTGGGIPEEDLNKIFDPFFTTKGVGEGTGLGLSIALGIVERHGGNIKVESKVGAGSTFTVRLPVDVAGLLPGE